MSDNKRKCKHFGYIIKDGDLVCADCGEPSPSDKWRGNVHGQKKEGAI